MKVLVVSAPGAISGGARRSLSILKEYAKMGVNATVIPPPSLFHDEQYRFTSLSIKTYPPSIENRERGIRFFETADFVRFLSSNSALVQVFSNASRLHMLFEIALSIRYARWIRDILDKERFDCILNHHESLDTTIIAVQLSSSFKIPCLTVLQLPPYYRDSNRLARIIEKRAVGLSGPRAWIFKLKRLVEYGWLRLLYTWLLGRNSTLLAVSKAPFAEMGLELNSRRRVLDPGNAIDEPLPTYWNKEYDAIHYARLVPTKGIFDALRVWHLVKGERSQARLLVAGRFYLDKDKTLYEELSNSLGANVSYLGYVNRDLLLELVGKSRCFVYPSYEDAFPLSVLESLFCGTHVIAYAIPALVDVYGSLPAVHLVPVGDIALMAKKVDEILSMPEEQYRVRLSETTEALKRFVSWSRVAHAELEALQRALQLPVLK